MSRARLDQKKQLDSSDTYDDALASVHSAGVAEGQADIEGDLNVVRSLIKDIVGDVDWFTTPTKSLNTLSEGGVPATANRNMAANVTTSDGQSATGTPIAATPKNDSLVIVEVNSVLATLGDGNKSNECYFSVDGGTTARLLKDITSGDILFWNGSIAKYELQASDRLSFFYDI